MVKGPKGLRVLRQPLKGRQVVKGHKDHREHKVLLHRLKVLPELQEPPVGLDP